MAWDDLTQDQRDALEQGDMINIFFRASIRLFPEDLAGANNDLDQAVQNVVGPSGAKVIEIED
jgi:hypothetical protein